MTLPRPDRKTLRSELIAQRETLSPVLRLQLQAEILPHLGELLDRLAPRCVGFCWPYRGEPDLREYLSLWRAQGRDRSLGLPVLPEGEGPLRFRSWRPGVPTAPDRFGIPAPIDTGFVAPDLLIVPVNGFDPKGYRIGYGGGFFDRTLAALDPAPRTIGVGFDLARVEDVFPLAHDRPLDWIVTESGIVVGPHNE
ncbi:5-formyltetrahydrofolate cyclo-ligase [Uliginosibacterium paludis]|uniref:5-formyltetrahydrofolate cyclo-ligase n=1 Tax=Uliginosibacterium paludis TaxID=1615952 RepID=A0ABV2CNA2_9RHOO